MSAEISIKYIVNSDNVNIKVDGEIDIYTSEQFKEEVYNIVDNNNLDLEFDFENLRYIDSTGLGILVGTLKKVKINGKSIKIVNMNNNVKKLFYITGLENLFIIEG